MHKNFITAASISGALAVILGAFAAHRLKEIYEPQLLQTFETAVKYQMYHSLALLAVGILYKDIQRKQMLWAGNLFIAGIIIFSGSLYALCVLKHLDMNVRWLGPVTPIGGLCFIAGWLWLAVAASKRS